MKKKTKDEIQAGIKKLADALPKAFDERTLMETAYKLLFPQELQISESTKYHLKNSVEQIPVVWNKRTVLQLYTLASEVEPIDLLAAWTKRRHYLSHYSALYWNELIEQKPSEYHLSSDLHKRAPTQEKVNKLNPGMIPLVFAKAHRQTQNFCTFKGTKFIFLERAYTNEAGVITKEINVEPTPLQIRLTNVERTLIDCVIEPQYAGGMTTVLKAFSTAENAINIDALHAVYLQMNLTYPYWQTIGFILERIDSPKSATWKDLFKSPAMDFYFDRLARSDWHYSKTWRVFFPKGLDKE